MSSGVAVPRGVRRQATTARRSIANTLRQQGPGGADTVREFNARAKRPPGTRFNYASADSQVLGLVLRAAVGRPLADYLSEKIWRPMGAEADATWLVDKAGYEIGYCWPQRHAARLGALRHAARQRRRARRQADHPRRLGEGRHHRRGAAPARRRRHARTTATATRPGSIAPRASRHFALLGVRGQAIFVDPEHQARRRAHRRAGTTRDDRAARGAQFRFFDGVLNWLKQTS